MLTLHRVPDHHELKGCKFVESFLPRRVVSVFLVCFPPQFAPNRLKIIRFISERSPGVGVRGDEKVGGRTLFGEVVKAVNDS